MTSQSLLSPSYHGKYGKSTSEGSKTRLWSMRSMSVGNSPIWPFALPLLITPQSVKKVGCSGDKPICSLCARLGQECNWSGRWKTTTVAEPTNPPSDLSTAYQFVSLSDDREGQFSLVSLHYWSVRNPSGWSSQENRVIALDEKVTEVLDQLR